MRNWCDKHALNNVIASGKTLLLCKSALLQMLRKMRKEMPSASKVVNSVTCLLCLSALLIMDDVKIPFLVLNVQGLIIHEACVLLQSF